MRLRLLLWSKLLTGTENITNVCSIKQIGTFSVKQLQSNPIHSFSKPLQGSGAHSIFHMVKYGVLPGQEGSLQVFSVSYLLIKEVNEYFSQHLLPWHTCLFNVMALGWHLVQMPSGQGGWPSQPDFILQLMFSRAANFPLQEIRTVSESDIMSNQTGKLKTAPHLSAPPVSLRRYAWNDMCFTGGSRWFR